MDLPEQPVTLTVEQLKALNGALSKMRHDIRGKLAVVVGNAGLILIRPSDEMRGRINLMIEQSPKILEAMEKFSDEFEKACGINRRKSGPMQ
jgi:hypothetical protein